MMNFGNILSTFYYLNPFHRCRESAWASFSSLQEHFMGHCYQVKQWLPTHQSTWAALSGSLSISPFVFLCVLISFSWTIRANLKDAWSVDPVFPADLCEPWVKGSTCTGSAHPPALGGFVTVHEGMISAQFLCDIQEPKYNRRARGWVNCHRDTLWKSWEEQQQWL